MNKALSIIMITLVVFGLGVVATVATPSVSAAYCGGPGEPPCADYCTRHPEDPVCQDDDSRG